MSAPFQATSASPIGQMRSRVNPLPDDSSVAPMRRETARMPQVRQWRDIGSERGHLTDTPDREHERRTRAEDALSKATSRVGRTLPRSATART
jgi:hypothetical protein